MGLAPGSAAPEMTVSAPWRRASAPAGAAPATVATTASTARRDPFALFERLTV